MEIDFNQLDKRFRFYLDAIEIIKQDKIYFSGLINDYYLTDRLQIINEIDSFVKTNPENKEKYLTPLLRRYNLIQELIIENFGDNIYDFRSQNMGILTKYDGTEKINFLDKIIRDTNFIIEHLNELLNPEIQEQPESKELKSKTRIKELEKSVLSQPQIALLAYYMRKNKIVCRNIENKQLAIAFSILANLEAEQLGKTLKVDKSESFCISDKESDYTILLNKLRALIATINEDLIKYKENSKIQ